MQEAMFRGKKNVDDEYRWGRYMKFFNLVGPIFMLVALIRIAQNRHKKDEYMEIERINSKLMAKTEYLEEMLESRDAEIEQLRKLLEERTREIRVITQRNVEAVRNSGADRSWLWHIFGRK